MANKLICQGCDGEKRVEVTVGLYPGDGGYIVKLEECDECGGTGIAICVECGDDATGTYDGMVLCEPCLEAEKEWDAAESVTPEVRP